MIEHTIAYAYYSSPDADRLGYRKSGCHTVKVPGKPIQGFPELAPALEYVRSLGTQPAYFSLDHAATRKFLTREDDALVWSAS